MKDKHTYLRKFFCLRSGFVRRFKTLLWVMPFLFMVACSSGKDDIVNPEEPEEETNLTEAEKIGKLTYEINEEVGDIFLKSSDIGEMAKHIDEIKALDGVDDVWVSGDALNLRIEGGGIMQWLFSLAADTTMLETSIAKIATRTTTSIGSHNYLDGKSVCLVNATSEDKAPLFVDTRKQVDKIESLFISAGFDANNVKRIEGESVNRAFFTKDITNYDYVLLIMHGCYDKNSKIHGLRTGERVLWEPSFFENFIDPESGEKIEYKDKKRLNDFRKEKGLYISICKENRHGTDLLLPCWGITEDYINRNMGKLKDNAVIFNAACQSLMGNTKLGDYFINKGASAYFGYDESNSVGPYAAVEFYRNLLSGMTVQKAFDGISGKYKVDGKFSAFLKDIYNATGANNCIIHVEPEGDVTLEEGNVYIPLTFFGCSSLSKKEYDIGFFFSDEKISDVSNFNISKYPCFYISNIETLKGIKDGEQKKYGVSLEELKEAFEEKNMSLEGGEEYYYYTYIRTASLGEYILNENGNAFTLNADAEITNTTQTSKEYKKDGFTFSGKIYDYLYKEKVEVNITNSLLYSEWGLYCSLDNKYISLNATEGNNNWYIYIYSYKSSETYSYTVYAKKKNGEIVTFGNKGTMNSTVSYAKSNSKSQSRQAVLTDDATVVMDKAAVDVVQVPVKNVVNKKSNNTTTTDNKLLKLAR